MLIASLVSSCLALFLHAGTCPEGSLPRLSTIQPEVQSSEFQVRFQFAHEQQPENGTRGGQRERGMKDGSNGRGGFGDPEGRGGFAGPGGRGDGRPMDDRAQGDRGPELQRLIQRIERLERQLNERQGPGRDERAEGGRPPSREDGREGKRGQGRREKSGEMQGHRDIPEGGPRRGRQGGPLGELGGGGMGGGPGVMHSPGGPGMFERRRDLMEQRRGAIRERVGQSLPEIRERIIERAGPGGPDGRGGPREQIHIERRGDPDRAPSAGPKESPNEHRILKEGSEIRVEDHRDGNAGPQNATDPRLERILHMVERLNERLDRLEKQASQGEAPMPQDRPGDAPRPRGSQGGGRGGPEGGSGGGR